MQVARALVAALVLRDADIARKLAMSAPQDEGGFGYGKIFFAQAAHAPQKSSDAIPCS